MQQIISAIEERKRRYEQRPANTEAHKVDRAEFTLLLSGISMCRRMPGVAEHMGYEKLYHCESEDDQASGKEHLQKLFGVTDKKSLIDACYNIFHSSEEYEQFMTFWAGAPLFDLEELNPQGKKSFLACRQLAERFYPIVKEKGFYAWDYNERIGLCRKAAACGIITDDEFWDITDPWVRQAQVFYHSYAEYAISCLCGAVYDMGKQDPDVAQFFELTAGVIDSLMDEGGAWQRSGWYEPKEREWADLLRTNPGCLITKAALEAEAIGYMYREEPVSDVPDCGWRFFIGNEPPEYVDDAQNITVCGLNTICNLEPDVMAYLHAPMGKRYGRQENGWVEE